MRLKYHLFVLLCVCVYVCMSVFPSSPSFLSSASVNASNNNRDNVENENVFVNQTLEEFYQTADTMTPSPRLTSSSTSALVTPSYAHKTRAMSAPMHRGSSKSGKRTSANADVAVGAERVKGQHE